MGGFAQGLAAAGAYETDFKTFQTQALHGRSFSPVPPV